MMMMAKMMRKAKMMMIAVGEMMMAEMMKIMMTTVTMMMIVKKMMAGVIRLTLLTTGHSPPALWLAVRYEQVRESPVVIVGVGMKSSSPGQRWQRGHLPPLAPIV